MGAGQLCQDSKLDEGNSVDRTQGVVSARRQVLAGQPQAEKCLGTRLEALHYLVPVV